MQDKNFNYNEFYKTRGVDFLDSAARFSLVSSLCRGKVFDIGCGFGVLSDYYFGDYIGFDFSEHTIENAKEIRRKDAKFRLFDCSDLSNLNIEDADTFFFGEFLEHFENDDKILGPIFKRAKPGSRIVFTTPNGDRIPDPSHLRILTIPQLRKKFSPYGKVKFYNWENASKQIICTIDLGEKNDDLVSLVMIAKNEELGIERAILSCLDFVDNIVVAVDNKSTDKTKELAKLYADEFRTFTFVDDFATARNLAHQGVKTKWCFFLDGHEYVFKKDNLEKFLKLDVDGLLVSIEMENKFLFNNPRFYKTGIDFVGRVHEIQTLKSSYFYPDFIIKHDRLTAQSKEACEARQRQRDDMVPRIMGEEIKKNPKNIRAIFHLALHWQARKEYKKALSLFSRYLKISKNIQERWFVFFQRCLCYTILHKRFRAFWSISRADWEVANRWEVQKIKGMIFFDMKKYQKAVEYLCFSFHDNPFNMLYRPMGRDDSHTWNLVGECFYNLFDFDRASIAFDRSADLTENEAAKKFLKNRALLMRDILKTSFKK